jgi:predicted AAA+ superfamily ATPase
VKVERGEDKFGENVRKILKKVAKTCNLWYTITMRRLAIEKLQQWKASQNRKPLLLIGARQVGKTWLMKEFGKQHFQNVAYIMCENNPVVEGIFDTSLRPDSLLPALSAYAGIPIIPEKSLIIFDEIQALPKVLQSLKYFNEETPEYSIIAAGSTLGVSLHTGTPFPVGKVDFMQIYPLSFWEFVLAQGEDALVDYVQNNDFSKINAFHDKLLKYHKHYMFVGGMPEVVSKYITSKDLSKARKIQNSLIQSYQNDFSKYVTSLGSRKLNMIYNSIPKQISKENKKFIYGVTKTGARARDFEYQIQWLEDSSLIHKVNSVSASKLPLTAYEHFGSFKIFLSDVGLLGAMSGTSPRLIVEKNNVYTEFKGALAEQFICQELVASGEHLYYWSSEDSKTEIDFLIDGEKTPIPIEVKAGGNLKSTSLNKYVAKFSPELAIKFSALPYEQHGNLINAPLYLASKFCQTQT